MTVHYQLKADYKRWAIIIAASLLVILLFIYKAYTYLLPTLTEYLAAQLPTDAKQQISTRTLKQLDANTLTKSKLSLDQQARFNALFSSLIENYKSTSLQAEPLEFQLLFRNWPDTANAMALADGTIIVTDKLVDLIENDKQMAAILLHEIAHVKLNHQIENLVQLSVMSVSMVVILGDTSTLSSLLLQGAAIGTLLSYSRQAEREADSYAAIQMMVHYQDVQPFINILTRLKAQSLQDQQASQPSWFSTHPDISARINNINQAIAAKTP
ncbi:M48 family metallopeptidase [Catenovulum adriaticum]|uniref:M48 family metallopeptidase n=1 Tax=Catenovulum adriaticum TaxID=2984846 RepID=A0ABY7AJ23_9ALTE|nr:M48 family metallopeptidase [Catenovulum sp. TS8]WAJ69233.1 M48 family metallopeptidase [Catenovulum sp. TS8]